MDHDLDDSAQMVRLSPGESARVWTVVEVTVGGVSRTMTVEAVLEVLSLDQGSVMMSVSQSTTAEGVIESGIEEAGG